MEKSTSMLICVFTLITSSVVILAQDKTESFIQASNCFASNFISKLQTEDGNLISSPFSAQTVLTMLQMGAAGPTEDQLSTALQYKPNQLSKEDVKSAFSSNIKKFQNVSGVTLEIANSMWIQNDFAVKPDYKQLIEGTFKAKSANLDFQNSAEDATNTINDWAKDTTHGLIPKLFNEPLDPSTVMVLANAIYFKGTWMYQFKTTDTKDGIFYENDDKSSTKTAPLMHQERKFRYKEDLTLNAQVLELNYKDNDMSMIIVLPKEGSGLKDLEKKLDCKTLPSVLTFDTSYMVNVTLPKFDIASDLKLEQPLKDLGITSVFDPSAADLSGIADNLVLSKIIQKAVIKVYEEGSEAAAVTGGGITTTSVMEPPVKVNFKANRPFIFLLKHNRLNMVLFAGKLNKIVKA